VAMKSVSENEDIMIITDNGIIIRMAVSGISRIGRNAMGVKLIKLTDDSTVTAVAKVEKDDESQTDQPITADTETDSSPAGTEQIDNESDD